MLDAAVDAAQRPEPGPPPKSMSSLDVSSIVLGRGATCVVWLAKDRVGEEGEPSESEPRREAPESTATKYATRQFALKAIKKASIVGQSQLDRLYREKELLKALDHASVVECHTTLQDETHLYFVLELLSGGELLWHMRRCPQRRVPPATARVCLAALLLPLGYMQSMGVLYRDLKPTNIVFSAGGRLKLVDFG